MGNARHKRLTGGAYTGHGVKPTFLGAPKDSSKFIGIRIVRRVILNFALQTKKFYPTCVLTHHISNEAYKLRDRSETYFDKLRQRL
jgi:hypothetical protein